MSFSPSENLRDAILKKKARIAEIERILNRPPQTKYRGQPVHGGQNWRLGLENERQHLLVAIPELEREQEHQGHAGRTSLGAAAVPQPNAKRQKPERGDPEVAKRTALVRSNPNTPADEMCETFDRERVPLLPKWQDAGFKKWSSAYNDAKYRSRIDTLISKARRKN